MKYSKQKSCVVCKKQFFASTARHMYCNKRCSNSVINKKATAQFIRANTSPISGHTKGAIQELRIAIDLMNKGFHVFRSLSPSCPCDLVAMKDGISHLVEVKSGIRLKSGKVFYEKTKVPYVCYAVGLHDGIYYTKELK